MSRVAVVIGHNASAQGAYSEFLGQSEFPFNRAVFAEMARFAPSHGLTLAEFLRLDAGSYSREIDAVYDKADAWNPDVIVELHFNAGGGAGSEMLFATGSAAGRALATALQEAVTDLGFADRGAKARSSADRGGRSLFASRHPTVICEPFFGDRESDCALVQRLGPGGLAAAYLAGLSQHLGLGLPIQPVPPAPPPPVPEVDPVTRARWQVAALSQQADILTEHGRAVLDEAEALRAAAAQILDTLPKP